MTSFGSTELEQRLPAEPEVGGILVAFCTRDVRVERRFPADADVSALYDFVRARHDTPNRFRLMSVPRAEVARRHVALSDAFAASRVRVVMEPIGKLLKFFLQKFVIGDIFSFFVP